MGRENPFHAISWQVRFRAKTCYGGIVRTEGRPGTTAGAFFLEPPNRDLVGLKRGRAFLSSTPAPATPAGWAQRLQYCVGEIDVCVQAYKHGDRRGIKDRRQRQLGWCR